MMPVSGISGKLYGHAFLQPEFGGPVFDMSLEEYQRDKFDIIGNPSFRQQWVPEFYEVNGSIVAAEKGRATLAKINELRKRTKAAGVWVKGMTMADMEAALVTN